MSKFSHITSKQFKHTLVAPKGREFSEEGCKKVIGTNFILCMNNKVLTCVESGVNSWEDLDHKFWEEHKETMLK